MNSSESNLDRLHNPEALAAAQEAVAELPFNNNLALFRFKLGRSWIYFNKGGDDPDVVVKVEPDSDGSLQDKRKASVLQIQELRERGAPVQNNLISPRSIGRYVVSITEFLPGSFEATHNFRSFGAALATFHTTPIDSLHLPRFDPLAVTRDVFKTLIRLRDTNNLPHIGNTVFDEQLIDKFKAMLEQSEEAAHKLEELSQQKGQSPSLLHNDITPFNAMIDKSGNTILIDLDRYTTGPWAYDLARVVDHWPRFKRDPKMTQSFLKGYIAAAPWTPDSEQIKLGVEAAKARYAATLMGRVVSMAAHGQPQNEYLLRESISRINGSYYWHSEEAYIRAQT